MVKRVKVTADTFDKKPSALDKLVGNVPDNMVAEKKEAAVEGEAEPKVKAPTTRNYKPTSFYLDETQLDKLDELVHEYKKRTGKRINRNDVVRSSIDKVGLTSLIAALEK